MRIKWWAHTAKVLCILILFLILLNSDEGEEQKSNFTKPTVCMITGFRREVGEYFALLGRYAANCGKLQVVVRNYHGSLRTNPRKSGVLEPAV